jgi:DNA-binding response OmpR family regulator
VHKILLAGHDPRLLTTRAALLKKTGAEIVYCNSSEALRILESERLDLVVLCHSLGADEAERIADRAHKRSGKTRVLMVTSDLSEERLGDEAKFDAMTLPDPTRLITRATELLQGLPNHHLKEFVTVQQIPVGL